MPLAKDDKQTLITSYRTHDRDTGSPEVQVALLSKRIDALADHFKAHAKDHSSRRGLVKLLNQRRRHLNYLKTHNFDRYRAVIDKLGLRK
ncbi:MAG: 30S ribosomal protein S15 [bacterium]